MTVDWDENDVIVGGDLVKLEGDHWVLMTSEDSGAELMRSSNDKYHMVCIGAIRGVNPKEVVAVHRNVSVQIIYDLMRGKHVVR